MKQKKVFGLKKLLKGSGVITNEGLTLESLKIVNAASEKYRFKNFWTYNDIIFAKTKAGVEKLGIP